MGISQDAERPNRPETPSGRFIPAINLIDEQPIGA
jgi:hypothetical protein